MVESNSKAIWFDRGCPISIQKRVNGHFLLIFDILNRVPLSINRTDWNPLSVVKSSLLINSDDRNLSNMNHIRSIVIRMFWRILWQSCGSEHTWQELSTTSFCNLIYCCWPVPSRSWLGVYRSSRRVQFYVVFLVMKENGIFLFLPH